MFFGETPFRIQALYLKASGDKNFVILLKRRTKNF